ncbi:MAG: SDR family NAD(P)-dependent oxidoreductase [Burkholderiales bacterium]
MSEVQLSMPADFAGRVAVITGGASGIGFASALQATRAGMKIAIADIEADALERAVGKIREGGGDVIGIRTDVSDIESVRELAQTVQSRLGDPWLVMNNAGVAKLGLAWELKHQDWSWVLGVNLNGVINGVATFLPCLVARKSGYMVNTASAAGLLGVPGGAPYVASKHAVVGLSESIFRELKAVCSPVGISVLCPAAVDTRIAYADRNQPGLPHYESPTEGFPPIPLDEPINIISPNDVATQVFDAIQHRRFWILPHAGQIRQAVINRAVQMVDEHNPDSASMDHISALLHSMITGVDFIEKN